MQDQTLPRNRTVLAFIYVTCLFFAWGFITAMIDPLVAAVKKVFTLDYTEALLTQFFFFTAYAVMSLPAAGILARLGYARSMLLALGIMIGGCLLMPVATHLDVFALVLLSLFIIASGITLLQVAANPLAAALGKPEGAHFRLTLSQAFNSLGTTLAPFIGAQIMLRGGVFSSEGPVSQAQRLESLSSINQAFLSVAVGFGLVAALVYFSRQTIDANAPKAAPAGEASPLRAFSSSFAILGAVAIFVYVGAEVAIGSGMINFLEKPQILGITHADAGKLLSYYWGGAMVGRLLGSMLLSRFKATDCLVWATGIAAILTAVVALNQGTLAAYAALSIGLFNSIMFPIIFTLTLERSSAPSSATSGLMCMAIVGGAILPLVFGQVADHLGLSLAFFVPCLAYVLILLFGLYAAKTPILSTGPVEKALH